MKPRSYQEIVDDSIKFADASNPDHDFAPVSFGRMVIEMLDQAQLDMHGPLKSLMESLEAGQYCDRPQPWYTGIDIATPNSTKECEHKYIVYNGFSESYEFCEKCDKRKV